MVFIAFGWLIATALYFIFILSALCFVGEQALQYFRW
jgi:hypothetical protein